MSTARHRTSKTNLAELRARVRALERGERGWAPGAETPGEGVAGVVPLGLPALDAHLPDGGLRLAGLHEILGARAEWDDALVAGFCLALLSRLIAAPDQVSDWAGSGAVLWAARRGDLYGPGLAGFLGPRAEAVLPGRLILLRARRDAEVLWALEEGLRAPPGVLSAVVGEVAEPDDTALRRLQLAAETAGRPCFLLRRRLFAKPAAVQKAQASLSAVALTRWRVGAQPAEGASAERGLDGSLVGRPRWRVELLRCRGAAPGSFVVEWDDATHDFALAAPVRDRPLAPGAGSETAVLDAVRQAG